MFQEIINELIKTVDKCDWVKCAIGEITFVVFEGSVRIINSTMTYEVPYDTVVLLSLIKEKLKTPTLEDRLLEQALEAIKATQ